MQSGIIAITPWSARNSCIPVPPETIETQTTNIVVREKGPHIEFPTISSSETGMSNSIVDIAHQNHETLQSETVVEGQDPRKNLAPEEVELRSRRSSTEHVIIPLML
jgi:hypothetical protein